MATAAAYSFAQLEQLARSVGLSASDATVAAAIARAESGGNPRAISSTGDYGLWQVNARWHPQYNAQLLLGPGYNARAMAAIHKESGWSPWATYTNGRYRAFLPSSSSGGDPAPAAGGIPNPLDLLPIDPTDLIPGAGSIPGLGDLTDKVLGKVTLLMFGLLLSGAGLAIVGLGLQRFASKSETVSDVQSTLGTVANVAAVAAV